MQELELVLKEEVRTFLQTDFILNEEVPGIHLIEGVNVKCDFLVYPRHHLIGEGFDEGWIGIECKYIDASQKHTKKINQLGWQSISYAQSKFHINNQTVRPMFVLMCVGGGLNMSVHVEWRTLMHFVQYGNVGKLAFDRAGWDISFGGSSYFYSREYQGVTSYTKSKANIGRKRYVGNLAG